MVNRLTEEDELNKLRDTISFLCINLFFFYGILYVSLRYIYKP